MHNFKFLQLPCKTDVIIHILQRRELRFREAAETEVALLKARVLFTALGLSIKRPK